MPLLLRRDVAYGSRKSRRAGGKMAQVCATRLPFLWYLHTQLCGGVYCLVDLVNFWYGGTCSLICCFSGKGHESFPPSMVGHLLREYYIVSRICRRVRSCWYKLWVIFWERCVHCICIVLLGLQRNEAKTSKLYSPKIIRQPFQNV